MERQSSSAYPISTRRTCSKSSRPATPGARQKVRKASTSGSQIFVPSNQVCWSCPSRNARQSDDVAAVAVSLRPFIAKSPCGAETLSGFVSIAARLVIHCPAERLYNP
jgi:hypothetical protein